MIVKSYPVLHIVVMLKEIHSALWNKITHDGLHFLFTLACMKILISPEQTKSYSSAHTFAGLPMTRCSKFLRPSRPLFLEKRTKQYLKKETLPLSSYQSALA